MVRAEVVQRGRLVVRVPDERVEHTAVGSIRVGSAASDLQEGAFSVDVHQTQRAVKMPLEYAPMSSSFESLNVGRGYPDSTGRRRGPRRDF